MLVEKTLVEGTDYELEYGANDDRTKVTTTKSLTVKVVGKNGYRQTELFLKIGELINSILQTQM